MTTISPTLSRGAARHRVGIGSVGILVLMVVLWELFSRTTFVIPDPIETVGTLGGNLRDPIYLDNLRVTMIAITCAFILGTLLGGLLGLLLGLSRLARITLEPLIIGFNGVPKIVLYPVILPIFHLGYGSKIVMGILFALFPVLINVAAGVRGIPNVYWKLGRSLDASRLQVLRHLVLPAIRRPLLTGIRLAVSLSTVGVVLSEFFATDKGLGRDVLRAYGAGDYSGMIATVLLLIGISFVLSLLLWRLERRVD